MRKVIYILIFSCFAYFSFFNCVYAADKGLTNRLRGYILLRVEKNGEAYYLNKDDDKAYYLKDGEAAYTMMRNFSLGVTNDVLNKIPIGVVDRAAELDSDGDDLPDRLEEGLGTDKFMADSDGDGFSDGEEVFSDMDPLGTSNKFFDDALVERLKGEILLQVESHGEAWYLNPSDGRRYYMTDGEAAYDIMRFLSLGINDDNLFKLDFGTLPETVSEPKLVLEEAEDSNDAEEAILDTSDKDGDGLLAWQEELYGTSDYDVDTDDDGVIDVFDVNPTTGTLYSNKIYFVSDGTYTYRFNIDIPKDRYFMYSEYFTHEFTNNFSNLSDFVVVDEVIYDILFQIYDYMEIYPDIYIPTLVNNFAQELFYNDDFRTGLDDYPKYPVETLMDGTGDCEDTAFLLASFLNAIGFDVVLVEFSDHVGVGVDLELTDEEIAQRAGSGEISYNPTYYEHNGKKYYYIETTNTDYKIGDIATDYLYEPAYIHDIEAIEY